MEELAECIAYRQQLRAILFSTCIGSHLYQYIFSSVLVAPVAISVMGVARW